MRKVIFKTYICNEYNDGNVRGAIDVARHIRKNTPFTGKIAYSQREYSYDNYLIELARHTIEHIKKAGEGAQRLFANGIGLIYPDFISRKQDDRIIADAKYKPIDNIANKDYLQVLAYMFRFDAKHGYYLYPEVSGASDKQLWLNKGSTYEKNVSASDDISITKHGLKIPNDAVDYEDFVDKIERCEVDFKAQLLF